MLKAAVTLRAVARRWTFREVKKAPAEREPGLQVRSVVSLRDRSLRCSDFYPQRTNP